MNHSATAHLPEWIQQLQCITTFAEMQEVMRSPEFVMGGSPPRRRFLRDTLMMLDGDEHKDRKKLIASLFSTDAMIVYETELLEPTVAEVFGQLRATRGADGLARTDLVPLVRSVLYRISARVVGVDGVDTTERVERFRLLLGRIAEAVLGQFSFKPVDEVVREGEETLRMLVDEFLRSSLDRRKELVRRHRAGELQRTDLPKDILTLICLHGEDTRSSADDTPYNTYVWRECAFFLTATANTTTHAVPNVVVEVDAWLRKHPEDAGKLEDPEFLRRVAAESLRLHNAGPARFREALRDVTLSTGRKVAQGETLALLTAPSGQDPAVFGEDAGEFNPDRKQPSNAHPWGLAFGAGPHMCMGRPLVTGMYKRPDDKTGTEGTLVKLLKILYANGAQLDPDHPPVRTTTSMDVYESVPLILRKL